MPTPVTSTLQLRRGHRVDLLNQSGEHLNLAVHQLGAQFFDAAVRGPGQQIVRLRDVADRRYARTRKAAALPEESPACRVHDAGAIAASLKRVEQEIGHRLRRGNRHAPFRASGVPVMPGGIVHPLAAAEVLDRHAGDGLLEQLGILRDDAADRGHPGAGEMTGRQGTHERPFALASRNSGEVL